jgi:hypothetical protein
MASEFATKLDHLNATQVSINETQRYFKTTIHESPTLAQDLINAWINAVEHKSHKIALFYLANDIIQNDRQNTEMKRMFQLIIPKAISFIAANPRNMDEVRKILNIWQ